MDVLNISPSLIEETDRYKFTVGLVIYSLLGKMSYSNLYGYKLL